MNDKTQQTGFDIIGDVHGQADKLEGLLGLMDYQLIDEVWQHPERQAIFVGDLIDRGPRQLDSVNIARSMVENGQAHIVMGNHEFNAIAFATAHPHVSGDFLRTHLGDLGVRNRRGHQEFLDEVIEGSERHLDIIQWFKTIPLWLEVGGLRVIHACFDPASMKYLSTRLAVGNTVTDELMVTMSTEGHADFKSLEILIKGPEIALPPGSEYLDKDDNLRRRARYAWWKHDATTFDIAAVIPDNCKTLDGLPFGLLPSDPIPSDNPQPYQDEIPLFFGHYWCSETHEIVAQHAICVDYSAGKGGPLKAYRWDGEKVIDRVKLVSFG